jgi:hypothetical protein
MQAELLRTEAELAAITCKLTENEQCMEHDEQRMFFLLNADRAREDFYEIRSSKRGEVRRIVVNSNAEIIFDSSGKSVTEGSGVLPEFDEISESFLRIIPDDSAGRDYFRKLRGLMIPKKIPRDLPKSAREERKQAQQLEEEAVKEEGRQLRQIIVDNFRSQDCLERQAEIDEILQRKDEHEQEQATLQVCQDSLQETLLRLHQQVKEIELKRAQEEVLERDAKRKREHDGRRLAWLDRFDPPPRSSSTLQPDTLESNSIKERDTRSDGSTSCDDCGGIVDADADINSDFETMSAQ